MGRCVTLAWLAWAGCTDGPALGDDLATTGAASSDGSEGAADPPLVAWDELLFVRRTGSEVFLMTADRFGAGLGPIARVGDLSSWQGPSADGTVVAWFEANDEGVLHVLRQGESSPQSLAHVRTTKGWSPVGARMLLFLEEPGAARRTVVHDFGAGTERELPIAATPISVEWSADGERIAYVVDEVLWFVDVENGTSTEVRPLPPGGGYDWLPDGRRLVVGDQGAIVVIDAGSGESSVIAEWGDSGPQHLAVSPDGEWVAWLLVTGGEGGLVRIDGTEGDYLVEFVMGTPAWNAGSDRFTFQIQGHGSECGGSGCGGILLVDAVARERLPLGGARAGWAPQDDWLAIDFDSGRVGTLNVTTGDPVDVSRLAEGDPTRDGGLVWR